MGPSFLKDGYGPRLRLRHCSGVLGEPLPVDAPLPHRSFLETALRIRSGDGAYRGRPPQKLLAPVRPACPRRICPIPPDSRTMHNARFQRSMVGFIPHWRHVKAELNRLPVRHEDWSGVSKLTKRAGLSAILIAGPVARAPQLPTGLRHTSHKALKTWHLGPSRQSHPKPVDLAPHPARHHAALPFPGAAAQVNLRMKSADKNQCSASGWTASRH